MNEQASEPVISMKHDFDEVTKTWYVQATIWNLASEESAITSLEFVENALCGEEIKLS